MILKLAKEALKDSASLFVGIAGFLTAFIVLILVIALIVALVSSETFTSADLRWALMAWGFSVAFVAAFLVLSLPFQLVGDWRRQRRLGLRPLAMPIAVWVTEDALYVLELERARLCRIQGDDVEEVAFMLAGRTLTAPRDVVARADGTVFVADPVRGDVVYRATDDHNVMIASLPPDASGGGEPPAPVALALDDHDDLIVADVRGGRILRVPADGDAQVVAYELRGMRGVAVARDGTIFVSEKFAHRVVRIAVDGGVEVVAGTGTSGFAGDGGPAARARLASPTGLVAAPDGSLYIADSGNDRVRMVARNGTITTVAGSGKGGASGEIGQALDACLSRPSGLALWDGGLYVADTGNDRIRVVRPDATIETVAGAVATPSSSTRVGRDSATAPSGRSEWASFATKTHATENGRPVS